MLLATGDGGGDDEESRSDTTGPEITALPQALEQEDAGLVARYPNGWKRSERQGIINLESPDRCAVVSLSAPVPAEQSGRLMEDLVRQLRRSVAKATVRREPSSPPIGGAPTESSIIALRTKDGAAAAVRISVSRGRQLAHVVELVIRGAECERSAREARSILESIEYSR